MPPILTTAEPAAKSADSSDRRQILRIPEKTVCFPLFNDQACNRFPDARQFRQLKQIARIHRIRFGNGRDLRDFYSGDSPAGPFRCPFPPDRKQSGSHHKDSCRNEKGSDDFPDEPLYETTVSGGDSSSFTAEPGEYTVGIIADSKVTGSALIFAEPADEMALLGYTPDSLIGSWSEKIAGRGYITIAKASDDRYNVQVNWGNGASEMYVWTMTASPAGSNIVGSVIEGQRAKHGSINGKMTVRFTQINIWNKFLINSVLCTFRRV